MKALQGGGKGKGQGGDGKGTGLTGYGSWQSGNYANAGTTAMSGNCGQPMRCFVCGQLGHCSWECPSNNQASWVENEGDKDPYVEAMYESGFNTVCSLQEDDGAAADKCCWSPPQRRRQ